VSEEFPRTHDQGPPPKAEPEPEENGVEINFELPRWQLKAIMIACLAERFKDVGPTAYDEAAELSDGIIDDCQKKEGGDHGEG